MMRRLGLAAMVALMALLALCLMAPTAVAQDGPNLSSGVPIETGGIVLIVPRGDGPDGDIADGRFAGTLTLNMRACDPPESIPAITKDPAGFLESSLQLLLANVRAEVLTYTKDESVATVGGMEIDTRMKVTPGLALNLLEDSSPAKLGACYYPESEWDIALYAGLNLLRVTPKAPGTSPALSLTGGYIRGSPALDLQCRWQF